MSGHCKVICYLLGALLIWQTSAQNYRIEQHPIGDQLLLKRGKNKITFRFMSKDPIFEDMDLYALIGVFPVNKREGHVEDFYAVIYNTCRDSNRPDQMCMEAQVTINVKRGRKIPFFSVSFALYNGTSKYNETDLSTVSLAMSPGHTHPVDKPTILPPGSDSQSGTSDTGNPQDTTLPIGVAIGGYVAAACLLIAIVVMSSVLLIVWRCKSKQKPKDPA